jgi:hypothetical protein
MMVRSGRKGIGIFSIYLLIFLPFLSQCITGGDEGSVPVTADPSLNEVHVSYFHEMKRCEACIHMETWSYLVLQTYFDDEDIHFFSYNIEEPSSSEAIELYDVHYTSLYVNSIYDGAHHIEEFSDCWLLSGDKEAFMSSFKEFVQRHIDDMERSS